MKGADPPEKDMQPRGHRERPVPQQPAMDHGLHGHRFGTSGRARVLQAIGQNDRRGHAAQVVEAAIGARVVVLAKPGHARHTRELRERAGLLLSSHGRHHGRLQSIQSSRRVQQARRYFLVPTHDQSGRTWSKFDRSE